MKIRNDNIPSIPPYALDAHGENAPAVWYGSTALDGTIEPWKSAELCSLYLFQSASPAVTPAVYIKVASNSATADWYKMVGADSSGNVTVTGTLTAGDVVSQAG